MAISLGLLSSSGDATHQCDGDHGRAGKDKSDFLKLAASSPVLCEEEPAIGLSIATAAPPADYLPACSSVAQSMGYNDGGRVTLQGRNNHGRGTSHICEANRNNQGVEVK